MLYFLLYALSIVISCLVMVIALTIKIRKIPSNKSINSHEVSFLLFATIAMIVPGLNIVTALSYLYRAWWNRQTRQTKQFYELLNNGPVLVLIADYQVREHVRGHTLKIAKQ